MAEQYPLQLERRSPVAPPAITKRIKSVLANIATVTLAAVPLVTFMPGGFANPDEAAAHQGIPTNGNSLCGMALFRHNSGENEIEMPSTHIQEIKKNCTTLVQHLIGEDSCGKHIVDWTHQNTPCNVVPQVAPEPEPLQLPEGQRRSEAPPPPPRDIICHFQSDDFGPGAKEHKDCSNGKSILIVHLDDNRFLDGSGVWAWKEHTGWPNAQPNKFRISKARKGRDGRMCLDIKWWSGNTEFGAAPTGSYDVPFESGSFKVYVNASCFPDDIGHIIFTSDTGSIGADQDKFDERYKVDQLGRLLG